MLVLAVKTGEDSPPQQMKIAGNRVTIGRRQDNDFRIKDPYISAYHAEIVRIASGEYEIVDLQSFNGTFVLGQRIDRAPIRAGDDLRIGVLKARILEEGQTWDSQTLNPKPASPVVRSLNDRKTAGAPSSSFPDPEVGDARSAVAGPAEAGTRRNGGSPELPQRSPAPAKSAERKRPRSPAIPDPYGIGVATVLPSLAVEKAKIELKKIRADLEKTRADLAAARDSEQDAARKAKESGEAIRALERSKSEIESRTQREISDLKQHLQALTESKQALETKTGLEVSDLREQVRTLEGSKQKLESERRSEIARLRKTIQQLEDSSEDLRRTITEKDRELRRKAAVAEKERDDLAERESQLGEIRKALDRARAETSTLDAALGEKREELESLSAGIEKTRAETSALDAVLGEKREELDRLHSQIENAKAETSALEASRQLKRGELESLRSEIEKAKAKGLPSVTPVVLSKNGGENGSGSSQSGSTPEEPEANRQPAPTTGDDKSSGLTGRLRVLASGLPLFAGAAERRNNVVERMLEIERREARLIERDLKLRKQAGLEKVFRKRLKELEKQLLETEKARLQEEKRLEKKLRELKLAEDRIETSANLDEEIERRKDRLADLEEQLEKAGRQLEQLEARRDEMTSTGAIHSPNATARVSVRAAQALETAEEREAFAKELEEKIAEYEQYQQILRVSLHPDLATVQVMSRQVIRRIDLLEDMIRYYHGKFATDTASQLETLRDSLLDLLNENKVTAYSFPPGAELDIDRRRKIKIVESQNRNNGTNGATRILETVRPGYLCEDSVGQGDIVLRKAEVITQS